MTRDRKSPAKEWVFTFSLITIVFLGTTVVLLWNPWGHTEPLPLYEPVDLTQPVLVRADSEPAYLGSENCKECHSKKKYKKLWRDWTKGGHKDVECEACHGPAGDHGLKDIDPRPKMTITSQMLARPHALCMGCHAETPGRQPTVSQIECEKHLAEFKVDKSDPDYEKSMQCLGCHNAHRPVKK